MSPELSGIVALTDSAGGNPAINRYDEYGVPAAANTGRFQYTGQVWLGEVGLYYYKARFYSPRDGRFLQIDPVGYDGGVNLYAYAGDDPVNSVDVSGYCPTPDMKCPDQERMRSFFTGSRLGPAIGSPVQSTGLFQRGGPERASRAAAAAGIVATGPLLPDETPTSGATSSVTTATFMETNM